MPRIGFYVSHLCMDAKDTEEAGFLEGLFLDSLLGFCP